MVADVDLGVEIGAASSSSDADASSSRRWLHKNKRTRSARAGEARSRIEQAEAGARKANRILLADVDGYASKFRRAFSRAFLSFVCSLCYTIALSFRARKIVQSLEAEGEASAALRTIRELRERERLAQPPVLKVKGKVL